MKILAIGDFHGTFPHKFKKIIQREKIDLVVSNGDFFPFHYRKLWFKHCYRTDKELWEVIGKPALKKLLMKDLRDGEKAIAALNKVVVPVYTVVGNLDYIDYTDAYDQKSKPKKKRWGWYEQDFFQPIITKYKNIHRFDYQSFIFGEYVFIGGYGQTFPGRVQSKNYKKYRKKLDVMFKRFRGKKVVFVTHNVPYNTKLDKIGMHAHKAVRGKHYGSKMVRRVIDHWQPLVHIGGHIHEGRGHQRLGKTLCVNPGAAHEGHAAIIELKSTKANVKFIK